MAADPKLIAEVSDKLSRLESFDPFMPRDTGTYGFAAGVRTCRPSNNYFTLLRPTRSSGFQAVSRAVSQSVSMLCLRF
jgi:hypothetical protein